MTNVFRYVTCYEHIVAMVVREEAAAYRTTRNGSHAINSAVYIALPRLVNNG